MQITIPDSIDEFFQNIWFLLDDDSYKRDEFIYQICYRYHMPFSPKDLIDKMNLAISKGILVKNDKEISLSSSIITNLRKFKAETNAKLINLIETELDFTRIEDNEDKWCKNCEKLKTASVRKVSSITTQAKATESAGANKTIKTTTTSKTTKTTATNKTTKTIAASKTNDDNQVVTPRQLIKIALSKEEIANGQRVSSSQVKFEKIDNKAGLIEATISGSSNNKYILKIDLTNKTINHNCHDFIHNKIYKKQFCKHFFRVLIKLPKYDKEFAIKILEALAQGRENWKFIG